MWMQFVVALHHTFFSYSIDTNNEQICATINYIIIDLSVTEGIDRSLVWTKLSQGLPFTAKSIFLLQFNSGWCRCLPITLNMSGFCTNSDITHLVLSPHMNPDKNRNGPSAQPCKVIRINYIRQIKWETWCLWERFVHLQTHESHR